MELNPSVILQGTLTLVAAVTILDSIREIVMLLSGAHDSKMATLRLIVSFVILFIVMIVIGIFPTTQHRETPNGQFMTIAGVY